MNKMKIDEVKEKLVSIILEETQPFNPNFKAMPMKNGEFYKSQYFKNMLKTCNIRDLLFHLSIPTRYGAFCLENEIMVFLRTMLGYTI
ncbi:MAG: hypothetical protein HFJ38_00620 [Bacilli bacterium]|nr:hypothetical protein [Bacilli bacterium]